MPGVTNYITSETSSVFTLEIQTSGGFVIDSYQGTTMTVSASPAPFDNTQMNVTAAGLTTGEEVTYTFTLNFATQTVIFGSIIDITFPSAITISDPNYSANTCRISGGILDTIACQFVTAQTLRITKLFENTLNLNQNFSLSIDAIKNPRSTLITDSFQIIVTDANANLIYSLTTGKTETMTTVSGFQSISVTPGSKANGDTTTYTFSITLSNVVHSGEFIEIVFPTNEVTPTASVTECTGIITLATTLA